MLISPPREVPQPADFPPMGLSYIASTLKQNEIETSVLDAASLSWRRLRKSIVEKNPDIVGITCWTLERRQAFKTAKIVKETLPQAKILMGGHHATAFPEYMFKLAYADVVVVREGEITTLEVIKALCNNQSLSEVKGIVYQRDGELITTEPRGFIEDLDAIPLPSYDDFDLDEYLGLPETKGRAAAIITSRGCPYGCIYCSASKFWKRRWRGRSAENVLSEIEWLYRNYHVKAFMFFDDNFTIKKERAIEICQGILQKGLKINWVACSHVNQVDKELLVWMRKAGCYRIDYGVESGSSKILKNIKKGQTVQKIEEAFSLTHEAGIEPRSYLMVGNPGEDEDTIKETVELIKKIKPFVRPSGQILWILPDTEVYELAKSQGIISDDFWLKDDSMVYYTVEHNVEELRHLRNLLIKGITENEGGAKSWMEYIVKNAYYRYPILQKLRRYKYLVKRFGLRV